MQENQTNRDVLNLVREIGRHLSPDDIDIIACADYGRDSETYKMLLEALLDGTLPGHPLAGHLRQVLMLTFFGDRDKIARTETPQTPIVTRLLFVSLALALPDVSPGSLTFFCGSGLEQTIVACAERLCHAHDLSELPELFRRLSDDAMAHHHNDCALSILFASILLAAVNGASPDELEKSCNDFILHDAEIRDADTFDKHDNNLEGLCLTHLYSGEFAAKRRAQEARAWQSLVRRLLPDAPEAVSCRYIREEFDNAAAKAEIILANVQP